MRNEDFRRLELINVKCDVLIDDEDYQEVFKIIAIGGKNADKELGKKLRKDPKSEDCNLYLSEISGLTKNNPELSVKDNTSEKYEFTAAKLGSWLPLFFAKAVRAYLSRNGSDEAMACLDCLLMYLHSHLPAFPNNKKNKEDHQDILLRHLFFQDLAACGKPGLESLGYARRAADILDLKIKWSQQLYNIEFYRLWSKLNQGIGLWHSGQRGKAALEFNPIIKEFKAVAADVSGDDRKYWKALLYDQAVLFRAELQENLQFSYHTIRTLQRLDDPIYRDAKREKRLIKEALAYRDMRRLDEASVMIKKLLGDDEVVENSNVTPKEIFGKLDNWTLGNEKTGLWSETVGLLFDFYLARFEDPKDFQPSDVQILTDKLKHTDYKEKLTKSKTEKSSYYQQVARYLRWLSDKYRKNPGDVFYKGQINALYSDFRNSISMDGIKDIPFKVFGQYEYDRFVESMEKFYRNCNCAGMVWDCNMVNDELKFLRDVMHFEENSFYLYDFKKLEREQRIHALNEYPEADCSDTSRCFDKEEEASLFQGLLHCIKNDAEADEKPTPSRPNKFDEVKELKDHDYEAIMMRENNYFLEYLEYNSSHPTLRPESPQGECSYHFMGLQRWNSQTPTLTLSKGGGYLLYKQDSQGAVRLGIAIDPGFDFVKNLFHMGFTLRDIDFILLTHAHLDHIRDFEPIVSALLDLEKRTNKKDSKDRVKGKIHAIMSLGVYQKLKNVITNTTLREFLADTYIVDIEREIENRNEGGYLSSIRFKKNKKDGVLVSILDNDDDNFDLKITPTKAYHDDYSEKSDSFGYIINVRDDGCRFLFGYTGDTRWHDDRKSHYSVGSQYLNCDVVCIHLGAVIESEGGKTFNSYKGQACEALIEKKWHPYLFGLLRWIKAIKTDTGNKNKLILLSEFGEELKGGIRIDLIRRLNEMFPDNRRLCIPVDIGLNVILGRTSGDANPYQVWCSGCESFVNAADIRYRHFGHGRGDEALFYFCETCIKSKPLNILQDRMQHVCESGVPLLKALSGELWKNS